MQSNMKVYFAADHAGIRMKAALLALVENKGTEVEDLGAFDFAPDDDYPEFVTPLAKRVASEPDTFGIICAGSGQGEAMCANRVKGARAAVLYALAPSTEVLDREGAHSQDGYDIVRLARKHNNANILSIGARFVSLDEATEAVNVFLATSFSHEARHRRRIEAF